MLLGSTEGVFKGLSITGLHYLTGTSSSAGAGRTLSPEGLSSVAVLLGLKLCRVDRTGCCWALLS